jgi:hypothetical protein
VPTLRRLSGADDAQGRIVPFSLRGLHGEGCFAAPPLSRRSFLAGAAAASLAGSAAQAPAKPRRIDLHHHFGPPVHAAALTGSEAVEGVHVCKFSPDDIRTIDSENAIRVMPQLPV